jgi:hypothetical protein
MHFFAFSHVRQTCLFITFFGAFFKKVFNGFEISIKFCVFDTFLILFRSYLYFFQTLEPIAQTAQKIKKHSK